MTIQDVVTTFSDGNLGASPPSAAGVTLVVGFASVPAANVPSIVPSLAAAKATGFGPAAEVLAHSLTEAGARCIVCVPTTTAGTLSAVTASGGGPTVTVSGTPYDAYTAIVKMTLGGAVGTSKFKYSLDNGQTWSAEITTASTYPIPDTGVTVAFAAGTYVLDETYSFTTTAPSFSTSQLGAAIDAAMNTPGMPEFSLVYVAGVTADAAACATVVAALQAKLAAAVTNPHRFIRGVVECPNVADSTVATAFASTVADRVSYVARYGLILSALTGRKNLAPLGRIVFARIPAKPIGKDPSQVKYDGNLGTGPLPAALLSIVTDEKNASVSLDGSRAVTVRTYDGKIGFYVTNWPLLSASGSDYRYLQDGQVIDEAARVARAKALDFLSIDLETTTGGVLDPAQAAALDGELDTVVREAIVVPRHATDVEVRFDRTNDVVSTEELLVSLGVMRKGFAKMVRMSLGFTKSIKREAA